MVPRPPINSAAPDPSGRAGWRTPLPAMPRARTGRHGYTLLEMIVVLAILAVMVGLSWPAVQKMARRSRVNDAAKQVRNALAEARLAAIESGRVQVFRFQPGTGRFEVAARQEEDAGPAVLRSALDQMAEAAASARPAAADPDAGAKDLPGGIVFAGQEVAEQPGAADEGTGLAGVSTAQLAERQSWSDPIVFYPNGRTSNARIRLTDLDRYFVEVNLRGLTGAVRIGPTTRLAKASQGAALAGPRTFAAGGSP